jgi:hypothetical protein
LRNATVSKAVDKVRDPIFRIPLLKRSTEMNGCYGGLGCKVSVMEVDGVGFFISHKPDYKPTKKDARRHLMGRKETWVYVEADRVRQAVEKFYEEWEGARIGGGQGPESFALWIDTSKPITQFPFCTNLYRGEKGEYLCGEPYGDFTPAGCILDGYDALEGGCVGSRYFGWLCDFEALYAHGELFERHDCAEQKMKKAREVLGG